MQISSPLAVKEQLLRPDPVIRYLPRAATMETLGARAVASHVRGIVQRLQRPRTTSRAALAHLHPRCTSCRQACLPDPVCACREVRVVQGFLAYVFLLLWVLLYISSKVENGGVWWMEISQNYLSNWLCPGSHGSD